MKAALTFTRKKGNTGRKENKTARMTMNRSPYTMNSSVNLDPKANLNILGRVSTLENLWVYL